MKHSGADRQHRGIRIELPQSALHGRMGFGAMGVRGLHAVQTMQPPTRIRCSAVWTQMSPRRSGVSVTKRCERADAHRKCQMPFKCANFFKRRHADTAAASAAGPSKLRMNRTVKSSIGEKTFGALDATRRDDTSSGGTRLPKGSSRAAIVSDGGVHGPRRQWRSRLLAE